MPQVYTAILCNQAGTGTPTEFWSFSGPNAGTFFKVDVRNTSSMAAHVTQTAGTTGVIFTLEVTSDPLGLTGWAAAALRLPGGGAYAATGQTVAPNTSRSLFFDPTDNVSFVRPNITTQDGTKALITLTFEA